MRIRLKVSVLFFSIIYKCTIRLNKPKTLRAKREENRHKHNNYILELNEIVDVL